MVALKTCSRYGGDYTSNPVRSLLIFFRRTSNLSLSIFKFKVYIAEYIFKYKFLVRLLLPNTFQSLRQTSSLNMDLSLSLPTNLLTMKG